MDTEPITPAARAAVERLLEPDDHLSRLQGVARAASAVLAMWDACQRCNELDGAERETFEEREGVTGDFESDACLVMDVNLREALLALDDERSGADA
jgi:hypothetical protein